GAPSTRTALRRRDDVFRGAIGHFHVLTTILGVTSHFLLIDRRRQVKRIGRDQVERGPLPYLARKGRVQADISILILAGVVKGRPNIEAGEPGASRAVPECAGKGSSVRKRAG